MKDTYGNAKKMARKGGKMVIYESQILGLTLYDEGNPFPLNVYLCEVGNFSKSGRPAIELLWGNSFAAR